jgi:hypothetical protein
VAASRRLGVLELRAPRLMEWPSCGAFASRDRSRVRMPDGRRERQ